MISVLQQVRQGIKREEFLYPGEVAQLVEALDLALHAIRQVPVGIEDFAGERFYEICFGADTDG